MLYEYKNKIKMNFSIDKKHLIKPIEKIAKEMIKIGINKENKIDMITLYKSLLEENLKNEENYIFVAVIMYITKSSYDIISIKPFKLEK